MRGTKAYIASAGTAAVMLGASICTFALVSALVAFGSWPGASAHTNVDQVVLNSVQRPQAVKKVTVSKDAVTVAKRAARRAASKAEPAGARSPAGTPLATVPRTPSGASAQPQTAAAAPSAPSGSGGGQGSPVSVPSVPPTVKNTTDNVTTQVQNTTQSVQNQVDEVVNQVAPPPPAPLGGAGDVVNGATDAVGGLPPP